GGGGGGGGGAPSSLLAFPPFASQRRAVDQVLALLEDSAKPLPAADPRRRDLQAAIESVRACDGRYRRRRTA
ncbi:MAG TPA: hypothetical protein VKB41_05110, partial [Steroidobacteraceae bacterium]|nr:hypothetical protein [Steroidobacteraceae bacterium]